MKIILAPFYLHRSLLAYFRKGDPFINIKIISKEELEKFYYPKVLESGLIYLLTEKKYKYEESMQYLRYLPYIYNNHSSIKLSFLTELKKEFIERDFFYIENSDHNVFKNTDIDVYGYSEDDIEVKLLLKLLSAKGHFHLNKRKDDDYEAITFSRIEDEVYYVLNEIASLLDKGIAVEDIVILRRNKNYDYYLAKFAPLFGYEVNINEQDDLAKIGAFKEFDKLYKETHDIELSLASLKEVMKDDETYDLFKDIVNSLIIEGASFDIQYDYLLHRLKEKKLPIDRYDNAVEVLDEPIYSSNKHVYVMGFAQGQYPSSKKDSEYLSYEELHEINRNNSKDKTRLDALSLLDFFNSENHFSFTFSKKDLSQSYYLSPLSQILNMKKIEPKLYSDFYSEQILKYIYCDLEDLKHQYDAEGKEYHRVNGVVEIAYKNYDNQYKKINHFNSNSKLILSTTALDNYSKCPFAYYLNNVVKLDEVETTYNMALGKIAHKIFENVRKPNFDFNAIFSSEIAKYSFKNSELFLLNGPVKKQLQNACDYILKGDQYMKNPVFKSECNLSWFIDNNTEVVGKIDSLIFLDEKYFVCIDYKTGNTGFDPNKISYGVYTQLPTYAILVKNNKEHNFSQYELAGYYINHVLASSLKDTIVGEDKLIPDYFKLVGLTLLDLDAVSHFDSTIGDGCSSFISGVKLKSDGSLSASSKMAGNEQFENIDTTIKSLYIDMAKRIRDNDFRIWPLVIKGVDACKYCPFADICFVKPEQRRLEEEEKDSDE